MKKGNRSAEPAFGESGAAPATVGASRSPPSCHWPSQAGKAAETGALSKLNAQARKPALPVWP